MLSRFITLHQRALERLDRRQSGTSMSAGDRCDLSATVARCTSDRPRAVRSAANGDVCIERWCSALDRCSSSRFAMLSHCLCASQPLTSASRQSTANRAAGVMSAVGKRRGGGAAGGESYTGPHYSQPTIHVSTSVSSRSAHSYAHVGHQSRVWNARRRVRHWTREPTKVGTMVLNKWRIGQTLRCA